MNGMPHSLKVVLLSLFAALLIAMGVVWLGPMHVLGARNEAQSNGYSNQVTTTTPDEVPERRLSSTVHLAPTQKPSHTQSQNPTLREAQAMGPYTIKGNLSLAADGMPYLFHGIGRDGLEYSCTGDGHFDAQEL